VTNLVILGAGSWGTALAIALAPRFSSIRLWGRNPLQVAEMRRLRENHRYLPGFLLPECVEATNSLAEALRDDSMVLIVVPSEYLRSVVREALPYFSTKTKLISASKGIEDGTLLRMSQVIADDLPESLALPIAVLSGPTFAREVAAGEPAAVVVACVDIGFAEEVQHSFSTGSLRLYVSQDVIGVELGAALKNVIAIGGGICEGLGLGSNSVAALVARGLAEITRLAVAMGGSSQTLGGLAGLGDLVLTATGDLSRNRLVGVQLGQGRKLPQILTEMTMVAEGVRTCKAAYELGRSLDVQLPIINQMYEVLYESKEPRRAIRELMDRPLTSEQSACSR
jgi:glycerol-3-phosphate dehydrogenase (NAD(P)+)